MKFGINSFQNSVQYQVNRVGCGPIGTIDPFTNKPQVRKVWNSRREAEKHADWMRAQKWDSVQVIELN